MAAPPSTATSLQLLRWRSRTQGFVERVEGLELPVVRIPAGRFVMGSPEGKRSALGGRAPSTRWSWGSF